MKGKENYSNKVFAILKELHTQFPLWPMCRHLDMALEEYNGNFGGVEDKELYYLLLKYQTELDIEEIDDITRIIEGGKDLDAMMSQPDGLDENEY